MNEELIFEILLKLGFTENETRVYIFLLGEKPKKASAIVKKLKIPKNQLNLILNSLNKKGIIKSYPELSSYFSVIDLQKFLETHIKTNKEQYNALKDNKETLLRKWRNLTHQK